MSNFRFRKWFGSFFLNNKVYYLLNGLIIGLLLYFYTENIYEEQLIKAIARNISEDAVSGYTRNPDTILIRSLAITNSLEQNRTGLFGSSELKGFKASILKPITYDLMTGKGSCGSNALVLARILQDFEIPIRIAQMKVGSEWGGHILLEAKTRGEWRALDAVYNLYFRRPDGSMASFRDIRENWAYYAKQVPPQYNHAYRYEDVRYTNWNKIPILMPALRKVLVFFTSEEYVSGISLRLMVLRKWDVLFKVSIALYLLILLLRLYIFRKSQREAMVVMLKPVRYQLRKIMNG